MTQSKIAIAKRLAELRQDGSDPETLAKSMTVMKMHHEIEKILESKEEPEPEEKPLIQSFFDIFFGVDRE